jgi:hypothetical protein
VVAVAATPSSSPVTVHLINIDNAAPRVSIVGSNAAPRASNVSIVDINNSGGGGGTVVTANRPTSTSILDTSTYAATVAGARKSPLKSVPHEVVSLMLTYLDARSLVKFARTSSAHNSLASKKPLWMALLALPWSAYDHAGQPIKGIKMETHTKAYYAARRQHAIERRADRLKDHAKQVREVRENHRAWWCLLLADFALAPCLSALLCIFLICLVYQLAKHRDISMFALWPILAMVCLIALVATVMCCMKWQVACNERGDRARVRVDLVHSFICLLPVMRVMQVAGAEMERAAPARAAERLLWISEWAHQSHDGDHRAGRQSVGTRNLLTEI